MKKFKIGLLVTTCVLLVSFIITLFNPFVDDDIRKYAVDNYYEITFTEGENRFDEDYFKIEIKNVSGEDVFNNEFVFGVRNSNISSDNFIWFRIAKVAKGDTVNIYIYEDTGDYTISNKKEDYDPSTYVLALDPMLPQLDLDRCMRVSVANVDSESPEVYRLETKFWSLDKIITLSGTVVSCIGLFVVLFLNRHVEDEKKEEVK